MYLVMPRLACKSISNDMGGGQMVHGESIDLFVPGRLCLFGEHSDWAGTYRQFNSSIAPGMALVTGIEQGITARIKKCDRLIVNTVDSASQENRLDIPMELPFLKSVAQKGGYFSYIAGVTAYVMEHYNVSGLEIEITDITLPMKKGLSSSAAICVLTARAFNILYSLHLNIRGEMQIAYRGEQLTPSRCGRMDQACAYGNQPVCLTFDGDQIIVEPLKVGGVFHWVFADLMSEKDTMRILSDLNKSYPYPSNETDRNVHIALGTINLEIISAATKAIEEGDAKRLGALLDRAQCVFDSMIAPACPQELTAPKLHQVMNDPAVRVCIYGSKGIGSQGDGTIQFLAKSEQDQYALAEYLRNELGLETFTFTIRPKATITKAIIPIAGYGTRMYPATLATHKSLLPVVDSDGLAKPALFILLGELVAAGIEDICLIIGPDDVEMFNRVMSPMVDERVYNKLSEIAKAYERTHAQIIKRVRLIVQQERQGFGHAVWLGKSFTGNESVLVVLGDHLFSSTSPFTCTQQILDLYKKSKTTTIAIERSPIDEVVHCGTVSGVWNDDDMSNLRVSTIIEKPSTDVAAENLYVLSTTGQKEYFVIFGLYIITPGVFEALEHNIRTHLNNTDEIQLTDALNDVILAEGISAVVLDGKRYDMGIPRTYRHTVSSYPGLLTSPMLTHLYEDYKKKF